jgi:hypothetical protein
MYEGSVYWKIMIEVVREGFYRRPLTTLNIILRHPS